MIKMEVKIQSDKKINFGYGSPRLHHLKRKAIATSTNLSLNLNMVCAAVLSSFITSHQRLKFIKLFPKHPRMHNNFLSLYVHVPPAQLLMLGLSDLTSHIFLGTGFVFKGITISANFCIINHLLFIYFYFNKPLISQSRNKDSFGYKPNPDTKTAAVGKATWIHFCKKGIDSIKDQLEAMNCR